MQRGLFISLEGIDGAGKSTHVEFIRDYLQSQGHEVVITREPGGTEVGERIRELLLTAKHMHPTSELLLYFASRQELIQQLIVPKLNAGVTVLADRFVDASIAYQGAGRQLGVATILQVYNLLEPRLTTDLTLLFDVPLSLAIERLNRSRERDRIEQESMDFFARVQAAYHQLAKDEPERIKTIRTDQAMANTRQAIIGHLAALLARKK